MEHLGHMNPWDRQKLTTTETTETESDPLDLLIENKVNVEIKSLRVLVAIHETQLLSYLKLSDCRRDLLINFNVKMLKEWIKRLII
ncbi:MAG: hypothetical protein K1060chlam2_00946 [Chlamydiae bacterium]|nr:hypothetical protein [Chlamydiota bacterium]